jgi:hypothetical protein
MQRLRHAAAATIALAVLGAAGPAFADATLFLGQAFTPSNRGAVGLAVGFSLLIVGFEFEYASTSEEIEDGAPGLRTGMANIFVQTPVAIARLQPYLTIGGGGYQESLGTDRETNVGMNTGGGVKISLAGPIRARIDYRVIRLAGHPRYGRSGRLYAGVNVRF